jgi:hypothetical protein
MKHTSRITVVLMATGLLLSAAFGQNKTEENYSALWQVVGGSAGGKNMSLNIRIDKYNTDEEVKNFATLLAEGGPDKLRRALEKEDVGRIAPVGSTGIALAVARKLQNGNKTIIRLVTARDPSFLELRYNGRSMDYPYTILQLELDENGKGAGTAIAAAKIRFNKKKNTYEIESFQQGTAYNKLLNVYRMK